MKYVWKRAIAFSLALFLLAGFFSGCGGGGGEGVVVVIGEVSDLTGPASPALSALHYGVTDMVTYYNEEGLIPGVKVKLVSYDDMANPARTIPGYEWVRERGAKVVISVLPSDGEILKPFAKEDKTPLVTLGTSIPLIEPPGWAFAPNCPGSYEIKTVLKWISENHWNYDTQGIPKIGFALWNEPGGIEIMKGLEEYTKEHPDKFDYVGSYLVPAGTFIFSGEIEKLKDCDYICLHATPTGYFIRQFKDRGYTTTFIGSSAQVAFLGFITDCCGWEAVDGMLSTSVCQWWDEPSPMVKMAKELLLTYRAGQADDLMHRGQGYIAGCQNMVSVLEILRNAIEKVGVEYFDGQAFYDAALKYKTSGPIWEGYPEWGYGESDRVLISDVQMYEWRAEVKDVVRISDWLLATG